MLIGLALSLSVHCGNFNKFEFEFYDGNYIHNHIYKTIAWTSDDKIIHFNRYYRPTPCSIVGTIAYFTDFKGDRTSSSDRATIAEECCKRLK